MADGCVMNKSRDRKLILTSKDVDWLIKIKDLFDKDRSIRERENCCELIVYDTKLVNWLISWGCIPRKSKTLSLLKIPSKYFPDFVRGKTWRITFMNKQALDFTDWTHYDGHRLSLDRKFEKIQEARDILR